MSWARKKGLIETDPIGVRIDLPQLFRTPQDASWSATSISNKWGWLLKRPAVVAYCQKHEIPLREIRLYNFRHTFISHFLNATGDIYAVAQMSGTSVKMVSTQYGHPDADRLHEKFLAFHRMVVGAA